MNPRRNNDFAHFILVLLTGASLILVPSIDAQAAQKVPTSRIIVPEEPAEPESTEDLSIPTENLSAPGAVEKQDDGVSPSDEPSVLEQAGPPPEIMRDVSKLPDAVRQTRQNLLDAAKTGDIEKLRFLIGSGESATSLSIGGVEGDPIEHLKAASGDVDGQEILAILIEVLEAGYVHLDAGKEDEIYAWPYFFAWPLDKLTAPMRVELFRILTAGDLEDSAQSGRYIFYRAGIKPDGTWSFFVAGD